MLGASNVLHVYVCTQHIPKSNSNLHKHADGIAANKSVIMHMLSQVRVGMDLTRIVLPTFILEKRSLLEMYADFLSHPDIFSE